jgi:outer membrane protein assembly factor BamB
MRTSFSLLASLLLHSLVASAGETDWPQFRGPTGQGISQATGVPLQWSATENIAWKVAVPGSGWSSPVLVAGRIYLTAAVPDAATGDTTLHALCLSAQDGSTIWNTEVFRPDAGAVAAMHRKNSPASATAIVEGGKVYVHFGHMGTAALDLSGQVLWRQTSLGYQPTHGNGGSPVLVEGKLIFSADGDPEPFVAALQADTGGLAWKTPRQTHARNRFSFSTPLAISVGGATQVISPGSGFVGAYAPADGRELWRVKYGEGYSVITRPVFAHGLLFVSSSYNQPWVYAIRAEGAAGDATETHVAWKYRKGAPNTPSMLVVGDELYFVADNGIATCADVRTGQIHWAERLGGDFSASPVLADSRIYFQNEVGVTYVVKPGPKFELLQKNEIGERTLASPAIVDGTIYLRSEKHLWKIGR